MDKESQLLFEEITSKDIADLTKDDITFLKARRLYLTPAQRLAYQTAELNLFSKKAEDNVVLEKPEIKEDVEVGDEDIDDSNMDGTEPGKKSKK